MRQMLEGNRGENGRGCRAIRVWFWSFEMTSSSLVVVKYHSVNLTDLLTDLVLFLRKLFPG